MEDCQSITLLVLMLFSIIFIAIAMFLTCDISNYTPPNFVENERNPSKVLKPMPNQNMYLVYYNGYILDIELTKNLSLRINEEVQIPKEDCGVFAVEYDSMLWTFFGSMKKETMCFDTFLTSEKKKKKKMPILFENDASAVRVGRHLWIIGGNAICGIWHTNMNTDTVLSKKPMISSVLWSLDKMGWGPGPSTKKIDDNHLALINTCSLALNATAVLFIGLVHLDSKDFSIFSLQSIHWHHDNGNHTTTAIYNFELGAWYFQEPLDYDVSNFDLLGLNQHKIACAIYQSKSERKILTIANTQTLFSMKEQTQQHAWMSEISKIKWISVEIENPSLQGTLVTYKGILYHFADPNQEKIFGYEVCINATKLVFKQLNNKGIGICMLSPSNFAQTEKCSLYEEKVSNSAQKVIAVPYYTSKVRK